MYLLYALALMCAWGWICTMYGVAGWLAWGAES